MNKIENKESKVKGTFKYTKPSGLVCLGLVTILCLMALLKTNNLHSAIFDLGIFDSLFWNTALEFNWSWFFFGHAQPLAILGTALYKLWPSSVILVCLQSIFLTCGIFLLLFSSDSIRHYRIIISLSFVLYFPLWYNALFDFHMDHLSVPLLFLFYYGCFKQKWWLAVVAALLLAMVKEPFALVAFFCGIYLCLRWRKFRWGLFICFFGMVCFYATTYILLHHFTFGPRGGLGADAFSWLGRTPVDMLLFIFTHPIEILKEIIFNSGKMKYLLFLFGALVFIPLFSPMELLPAVPILGISLLSRLENYYGIGHHYTSGLIPPMIVAFAFGYPKAENAFLMIIRRFIKDTIAKKVFTWGILGLMLFVHILISPSPISRLFWTNKVWSYGFEAYIPVGRDKMIKDAMGKYVPADPDVSVSSQNTLNWGHLAHRKCYTIFPLGVIEPVVIPEFAKAGFKEIWVEYVILDLKRPWFIVDRGCSWQTEESIKLSDDDIKRLDLKDNPGPLKWVSCASQKFRNDFLDAIVETKKTFNVIFERDGFMILRRVVK